jgi:ADP-ribosylglycohydrolase
MLGAIAGDIIGSVYEANPVKTMDFELFGELSRFTDDTVLTVATAHALLDGMDYAEAYRTYGRRYPRAGYGEAFITWLMTDDAPPYNSWGNGSAMRVSPVGYAGETMDFVLGEAAKSAAVTHNHPEGIKGAQAVAAAIFMGRRGQSKEEIRRFTIEQFAYDLKPTIAQIRPGYFFDVSCQGSVPQAIIAFLESEDVEDAIRLAISLGGDGDTQGCIAGAIAYAYYGKMAPEMELQVRRRLPREFIAILDEFLELYVS